MTASFFSYNKKYYCCYCQYCDSIQSTTLLLVLLRLGHQTFLFCCICHCGCWRNEKKETKRTLEPNKQRCCLFVAVWLWLKARNLTHIDLSVTHLHTFCDAIFWNFCQQLHDHSIHDQFDCMRDGTLSNIHEVDLQEISYWK